MTLRTDRLSGHLVQKTNMFEWLTGYIVFVFLARLPELFLSGALIPDLSYLFNTHASIAIIASIHESKKKTVFHSSFSFVKLLFS